MAKRVIKKRVSKVPKTRNAGTMTESAFWSFIRATLRNKSRWWKPITNTKTKARRAYTGPNKRQKFEYQCNVCKNWFADKEVAIDHINPVGTLKSAQDLPEFVENLFIEEHGLQCICNSCHDIKTKQDIINIKNKNK